MCFLREGGTSLLGLAQVPAHECSRAGQRIHGKPQGGWSLGSLVALVTTQEALRHRAPFERQGREVQRVSRQAVFFEDTGLALRRAVCKISVFRVARVP